MDSISGEDWVNRVVRDEEGFACLIIGVMIIDELDIILGGRFEE